MLGVGIALFIVAAQAFLFNKAIWLFKKSFHAQGVAYVDLLERVRLWCASQGGVYVIKRVSISTNPYLVRAGVHPDIHCTEGLVLTLRKLASVVREVSESSAERR